MQVPEYTVKRSPNAKSIRLKVTPHDGLSVIVPRDFDEQQIPAILLRKKVWIAEKLEQAIEKRRFLGPMPIEQLPEFLPLRALSQEWRISYKAVESKIGVWLRAGDNELVFESAQFDRDPVILKLKQWLRSKVRGELFPLVRAIAAKSGFEVNDLLVKSQRTRWASCSSRKNLSLNTKLLFIAPELVRYVIMHELSHTVHMNHSSDFWRLVACHEPAYKILDSRLRDAWKQIPTWVL